MSKMNSLSKALEKVNLNDAAKSTSKAKPQRKKQARKGPVEPFRFFDLPSEIRLRIYGFVLFTPRRRRTPRTTGNVGASSKRNPPLSPTSHRVALFLTSRRMHNEASDYFYATQTFRLFHIQDYSRMPTIRAIAPQYRPSIATIELILGSSWTAPPREWTVTRSLGLEEMVRIRTFKVFIECDPSHPVFEGFRVSKDYYTDFAGDLLSEVLSKLPNLEYVEFDAWPSVRKSGALMKRLMEEVRTAGRKIAWGPERGWTDYDGEEFSDDVYGIKAHEKAQERAQQEKAQLIKAQEEARELARLNGFSPQTLPVPLLSPYLYD
ncbi:hypothetical protein BO94DRAFT_538803 [Aspergillus sclerotioniger CBS 115572]|uniref:Uncharacterized protein n=1 Tax=Aspergillus sclerotioniger CBS 115572 TaxID=1450535 RepID=A0A317VLL6_9EURO|nr:hypothetical protein BO94DRAFT_538803 [Aspergillus sclerotioniger CBS 115572]PWY73762.1 hypothetical protein BO94DRAFT_538803 [Aspergillus sclerotioniger CBS 115572]